MTSLTAEASREESTALKAGVWLMSLGAVAFIGYAVIFFILNFTDSFLELGIGSERGRRRQGRDQAVRQRPLPLHRPPPYRGFGLHRRHRSRRSALSWFGVRRGYMWAWVAAVTAPVLGLAVALPAHYPYGFDTIGHLGLIYLATAIFVVGAVLALKALLEERR